MPSDQSASSPLIPAEQILLEVVSPWMLAGLISMSVFELFRDSGVASCRLEEENS